MLSIGVFRARRYLTKLECVWIQKFTVFNVGEVPYSADEYECF